MGHSDVCISLLHHFHNYFTLLQLCDICKFSDDSIEDGLYSYLISHISSNPGCFNLLQFIRFEYLSSESISDFMSSIPDFMSSIPDFISSIPDFMGRRLWSAISPRLIPDFFEWSIFSTCGRPSCGGQLA
jgi:hypothetical protein